MQCVGKEQSIPAVNTSCASPRVRESESPQSAEYIRPTDSVERPTIIHSFPSSSGRSGSTLSGGAAHHKFCACFSPPTLYCCARLWFSQTSAALFMLQATSFARILPTTVKCSRFKHRIIYIMHGNMLLVAMVT